MKVLIITGTPSTLPHFRGPLIKAMLTQGHQVCAAANGRDPDAQKRLADMGVEFYPIRMARAGMNPLSDLVTLMDLVRLMREVKPDLVFSYTIKSVIYGGWAARLCGIKRINSLICGLGYAFNEDASFLRRVAGAAARFLYGRSLRYSHRVFFQNPDDQKMFLDLGLIRASQAVVVNGSGVDLSFYAFDELGKMEHPVSRLKFLLVARLLKDKGIVEYVEAARIARKKYPFLEFVLVGGFDLNPSGLKPQEIKTWQDEGLIDYQGEQKDVRPFIQACHVYVLPSCYREGVPRSTLEAMAIGRAVITTDAPGCRETIDQAVPAPDGSMVGKNGILVPVKDVEALARAMMYFVENPDKAKAMGLASRGYAEARYDVRSVNAVMLKEMGLMP